MAGSLARALVLTLVLLTHGTGRAREGLPLLPGIGAADPRVTVDATAPPWRGIGRVQTELGTRCTGFLISSDHVMTAAHCLYLHRPQRFIRPDSVHFVLGEAFGHYIAHARVRSFAVASGYDPGRPVASLGADWAVLTLDTALGTPDRIVTIADAAPAAGTRLMLGGYSQDRQEMLLADRDCRAGGFGADAAGRALLRHTCAGTRGTSGAPLLALGSDGAWHAVGIEVGAVLGEAGGFAVSLPPHAAGS